MNLPDNNDIPEGIGVVSATPLRKMGRKKINWLQIKQDYLADPQLSLSDLERKYSLAHSTILQRSARDQWAKDRRVIYADVGKRAENILAEKQAQIAVRHALIGKLLQRQGIEAIKKKKAPIKSAKVALEYAVEGVRIEREAEGLDQRSPQVVNIISQQQGIIDKYTQ